MASVYLETTIVSYLTSRPSRDVLQRAHQQVTRRWWRSRRSQFTLYVSPFVLQEAIAGNPLRARRRLAILRSLPLLTPTAEAFRLARVLVERGPIPHTAEVDATHVAIAAVNGIEYLLTWNCAHIANAVMREDIEDICRQHGYEPPILCTPEELMED